jgi:hypothetical protein
MPPRTQRSASHVHSVVASCGHELAHAMGHPGGVFVQTMSVAMHVPHPHQSATHPHAASPPSFVSMLVVSLDVESAAIVSAPGVVSFAASLVPESPLVESIATTESTDESDVVSPLPESLPLHPTIAPHAASAHEPIHPVARMVTSDSPIPIIFPRPMSERRPLVRLPFGGTRPCRKSPRF